MYEKYIILPKRYFKTIIICNKERKMYWCAACGNPRVIIEKDKEGYSLAKGLVGSAVLGPVGALAGANGKEVTVFYCPKCGARLHKCMPEYEISNILKLEKEARTSAFSKAELDKLRVKYPNMLWPEDLDRIWNKKSDQHERKSVFSNEQDKPSALSDDAKDQRIVFSGDIKKDIKDYLNNINAPVNYSEVKDHFQKSSYSEIVIINGLLDLVEDGLIKHYRDYFALVRDLGEMIQLKECGNDNRKKLEEEFFSFRKELENSERSAQQKEEERIKEALSCTYKLELLSRRAQAQKSQSICETIADELRNLEPNKEKDIQKIEQSINDLLSSSNNFEETLNKTIAAISEKESELSNLSFLQRGRKRILMEEVEALNSEKTRLQKEKTNIENDIYVLRRKRNEIESSVTKSAERKQNLYNKERERLEELNFKIKAIEKKIDDFNQGKIDEKNPDYIEAVRQIEFEKKQADSFRRGIERDIVIEKAIALEHGFVSAEELQGKYRELKDVDVIIIMSTLELLQEKGYVEKKVMYGKQLYKSIMRSEYFKNVNVQSPIITKDEMKFKLFNVINDAEKPVNVGYLREKTNFSGYKNHMYAPLLTQMEKDGLIKTVKKDGLVYYYTQIRNI